MILERTMMFGFTLRNDIPTSSRMPTLASVIFAWIQRLKYLAKKMQATRENSAIAMITSTSSVAPAGGLGFPCANSVAMDIMQDPLGRGVDQGDSAVLPAGGRA